MPSRTKTFYVTLARVWMPQTSRWSTRFGVAEDQIGSWYWKDRPEVLAVFRLDATSRSEALGVTAEFMLRGLPFSMDVDVLYKNSNI